ncbi:protein of unknown function [Candidatus Methylomirabilis oxygeniifera]|uniref:Uncharacterized protein n=1 Tax=Methylomirabilis oxygeniifera TaxID=671143 RepID=D5MKP4_METO1|nr:protein of unknown function [Candidatus Methylomirabilis oxyfera]
MPIEITSGQTVTRDYLIGLQKWLALAGAFASKPLLIYAGDSRHTRSGIELRPWRYMPTSLTPFTSSTAGRPGGYAFPMEH